MRRLVFALSLCAAALSGCDMLGIESPEKIAAAREAEGKAVGGACRHAGRAIEDCYVLNRKADKAAVFAGWRDMNDYMRENKIDAVAPQIAGQVASVNVNASASAKAAADDKPEPAAAEKRAPKGGEGGKAKTKPAPQES